MGYGGAGAIPDHHICVSVAGVEPAHLTPHGLSAPRLVAAHPPRPLSSTHPTCLASSPFPNRYYRGADGIILVYDVTNEESFKHVAVWLGEVNTHSSATRPPCKLLIGNKCDDDAHRQVTREQGEQFAQSLGIPFMEASAKQATNVESAFIKMAGELVRTRSAHTMRAALCLRRNQPAALSRSTLRR